MDVLIIDDDPSQSSRLSRALNGSGHAFHHAQTVTAAFSLIREHKLDLILASVLVKDIEGIEALCRLAPGLPPIIFHASRPGWPSHLPIARDGCPFVPTSQLAAALESLPNRNPTAMAPSRIESLITRTAGVRV